MAFKTTTPTAAAASESGHEFEPRYPGRPDGIDAFITVRGPRSPVMRAYAARSLAESQARELEAKRQRQDVQPLSLDEIDARTLDVAVQFTMGWRGFEGAGGAPLEFSEAAARKLYTDHPWIRDQVIAEAQELGNFIKPLSISSSSTPAPSSA